MVFDIFGFGKNTKIDTVPDETLIEVAQAIVQALDLQITGARSMAASLPDSEERIQVLMKDAYFYGYVIGACMKTSVVKFTPIVEKENLGENYRRLLQSVIANLFYQNSEPDWDAVQMWEAQSAAYGMVKNPNYERGMEVGAVFAEEIISRQDFSQTTLLGNELFRADLLQSDGQ
ncbi:hypothetical protein MNBD_GAMMA20-2085 [hydrothermal vent metagenome]|uniref:Uncharacterized protein n=1 Tax=hydrothermal vent metagenome TaxID=652676 RepID=A0A3B1AJ20_9ZZZZ